jgi:nitrate reductase NapD
MPISGIVIKCNPAKMDELAKSLAENGMIEVHGSLPDGKIVAVIEATSVEDEVQMISNLLAIDGIIDVQMAYHNFEDELPMEGHK